ncbi:MULTISPECIES: class Ib ribonucleoside-diphosphate reductase assembly flavoprotein NrdI [Heyndrickxia]|uniref:class Ib ribonucleoside-diphosphate reductase assembly flavoprotein NrdI n=1 Tax=Heyndrickxia TaxID=2837504 RepID=UPI002E21E191|nr:class Ib ribonucleoside-diphosphate reductase assembly flavoprotein NrdI [Weizmannia sp. CD-2023]MED4892459.1 class Ib ribonucleoside-diphosphate reductase assembly flavoprotein NrdI [Weizmannia sp. CD-2023]
MIYYASLTGNVRRFVSKTGLAAEEIQPGLTVTEPFVLVTYTIGFGEVPPKVSKFLETNGHLLRGVAVSGNRNWGDNYGRAGDIIAEQYGVPLLLKFELAGTENDVKTFVKKVVKCGISD